MFSKVSMLRPGGCKQTLRRSLRQARQHCVSQTWAKGWFVSTWTLQTDHLEAGSKTICALPRNRKLHRCQPSMPKCQHTALAHDPALQDEARQYPIEAVELSLSLLLQVSALNMVLLQPEVARLVCSFVYCSHVQQAQGASIFHLKQLQHLSFGTCFCLRVSSSAMQPS